MRAVLPIQRHFRWAWPKTRQLKAAILAGALLMLPSAALAQTPPNPVPKPTPAIQKLLDDAIKIEDKIQRTQALKSVL